MMRRERAKNTQKKILTAAEIEFSQKGLAGARIDNIALLSKTNKRMIYEYFGDKEELYKVVLKKIYIRANILDEKLLDNNSDIIDSVKKLIQGYYEFLDNNPTFVKLIMWENLNDAEYLYQMDMPDMKSYLLNAIDNLILRGQQEGVFKDSLDSQQVAISLITFSFSYFSNTHTLSHLLHIDMNSKENIEKRVKHVTEIMLKYLLKE